MRLGTVIVESMLHAHRMGAGIRVGIVNDKDASRNGWVLTIFGQLDLQPAISLTLIVGGSDILSKSELEITSKDQC